MSDVQGNRAHDATDRGAPIKIGGKAATSEPSAVAADDRVDAYFDANGRLHTVTDGSLPAGTNNIGDVDIVSMPAAARTTDSISSAVATDAIMNNLTALTPKFAAIDAATAGDNTIVAAVASKKIRVLALFLVNGHTLTQTVRFESGAAGTALTGQMIIAANGGFVLPFNPVGWFESASGVLLNMELAGATTVDGSLTYVEV